MSLKSNLDATVNEVGFKKEIGLFGGVSIIGGIMIGSGIFYLGSYVLERTHMSMGLAPVSYTHLERIQSGRMDIRACRRYNRG